MGNHLTLDPLILPEVSDIDLPFLWLSAWLIDYVWQATAWANFDDSITEKNIVETSSHTFKLDTKVFLTTLASKNKKLLVIKNVLEKAL